MDTNEALEFRPVGINSLLVENVIFLNNGDATLQTVNYVHTYDNMQQLVNDIQKLKQGENPIDWNNNEISDFNIDDFDNSCFFWNGENVKDIDIEYGENTSLFVENSSK